MGDAKIRPSSGVAARLKPESVFGVAMEPPAFKPGPSAFWAQAVEAMTELPSAATDTAELRFLLRLRNAQAVFSDAVARHALDFAAKNIAAPANAGTAREEILRKLREAPIFQIAEFFYVLGERRLGDKTRAETYLRRHNDSLHAV